MAAVDVSRIGGSFWLLFGEGFAMLGIRQNPNALCASEFLSERRTFNIERSTLNSDRKSTRLNSSHGYISYAVFCLKKKKRQLETVPAILFPLLALLPTRASRAVSLT